MTGRSLTDSVWNRLKQVPFPGYFAGEIEREKMGVPADYNIPPAPNQKDLIDLEVFTAILSFFV